MNAEISAGELFGFTPLINISVNFGAAVTGRMAGSCGSEAAVIGRMAGACGSEFSEPSGISELCSASWGGSTNSFVI